MRNLIAKTGILLLGLLFAGVGFGQTKAPEKITEFGNLNSEDLQATMEHVSMFPLSEPTSFTQILINPDEKESMGSPYRFISRLKAYLNSRSIDESRIISSVCKKKPGRKVEIWLLPQESDVRSCEMEQLQISATTLFDSAYYENPEFGSCCIIDEFKENEVRGSIEAFSDLLKDNPEAKAYIFLYLGTNIYWRGTLNAADKPVRHLDSSKLYPKMFDLVIRILMEKGIARPRVIIQRAGYKDSLRNIELWVVPKGGGIPKSKPEYFPKRKRSRKAR